MKLTVKSVISASFIASIGFLSYKYYDTTILESQKFKDADYKYQTGDLEPLPGPNLAEGDPKDIHFEKLDLGIAAIKSISENGDVLYTWYGDHSVTFPYSDKDGFKRTGVKLGQPVFRVRRADGTIKDFPNAHAITMTRGGKVFVVRGDQSAYELIYEGKKILDSKTTHLGYPSRDWDYNPTITDDGIFDSSSNESKYLFKPDMSLTEVQSTYQEDKRYSFYSKGSTELGSFGSTGHDVFKNKFFHQSQIANMHKGTQHYIDLPEWMPNPLIVPTRKSVFVYEPQNYASQLWEYRDNRFTQIPVPSGSVFVKLEGANGGHEYVLESSTVDPTRKGTYGMPYTSKRFFVTNGKAYDFNQILVSVGLREDTTFSNSYGAPTNMMDENGDIVVSEYGDDYFRLYLLKRKK
ncbi:MAG: hypothetical protein WCG75_02185 [Armatimonadota bacterium]